MKFIAKGNLFYMNTDGVISNMDWSVKTDINLLHQIEFEAESAYIKADFFKSIDNKLPIESITDNDKIYFSSRPIFLREMEMGGDMLVLHFRNTSSKSNKLYEEKFSNELITAQEKHNRLMVKIKNKEDISDEECIFLLDFLSVEDFATIAKQLPTGQLKTEIRKAVYPFH